MPKRGVFGTPMATPPSRRIMREPALKPYDAPWRDDVAQTVSGWAGRLGANERNVYQGTKKALGVADWLPGVGDAATAADAAGSFRAGNYLKGTAQSALAAIGLVPGAGDAAALAGKGLLGKFMAAAVVPAAKKMKAAGDLPLPSVLNIPRVPTSAEMKKLSQLQRVPLSQVRKGNKLEWERFNKGDYGKPLISGYTANPVAVRLENGEHIVLDGNHRAALANGAGDANMQMHVISARDYDPANAGRAAAKFDPKEADDLLSQLGF